jgi:hypothetical protein
MKINIRSPKTNRASTLLAIAILAVIVGGALAAYLLIVKQETSFGFRSQNWNTSLMVAEAGVEDALALVNKYEATSTGITNWSTTAVSQDSWNLGAGTATSQVYSITRQLGKMGSYTAYVTNTLINTVSNGSYWVPSILSIGTVTNTEGPSTVRKVYVLTLADQNSTGGLLARTTMNFNGQKSYVDSFDSSNPAKSAWQSNWFFNGVNFGTYTNTRRSDEAVVGVDSNILNADGVAIYGFVDTGPGGTVSIKSGGTVGDLAWIGPNPGSPANSGIEVNHERSDMNVAFNDAVLPVPTNIWYGTNWLAVTNLSSPTNIGGTLYNYVVYNIAGRPGTPTNQIYWTLASLPKNKSMMILASNVVLYLPGGISMNSGDQLTVNTNANVTIYSGSDIDTGNGMVNNLYQYAPAMRVYGLNGCKNISFGGNSALTIWLYAPRASVQFNGGGNNTYDVAGAFMVSDVTINGHYNFHFDEVLKTNLPPYRYVADNWQEVH